MAKFKVRARTVDLLGRQQIANISTAISELFKNAHDAYAHNVEVDYFRDDGLFVLRDDGLGMTREEFEQRWLTLGTDSKAGSQIGLPKPPKDPNQKVRPLLGEKGIGRLAIAVIGGQVLVVTRAKRNNKASDTITVAYINWAFFELPGVDLDELSIPVREFPATNPPNGDEVRSLVLEAANSLRELKDKIASEDLHKIEGDMAAFQVDPNAILQFLGQPSFINEGCGTHFYIQPADRVLEDDIDSRISNDRATRFEKSLIGFTNTMTQSKTSPVIKTAFRDHKDEGAPEELVGNTAFFTPDEFKEMDHHLIGHFDEYGQFNGTVGIYQMEPEPYVLNYRKSDGKRTLCGPFDLSIAVMQGDRAATLVPPQEYASMKRKLDRHGGLYVYRDGVRIQPYGNSDYDWLDMERNRTKSASYYYYSFRRMFGAIEITNKHNFNLKEKSGREGFRESKSFHQFRSILMEFFLNTAQDFFREEGKYADRWIVKREELYDLDIVRRKQELQQNVRKKAFQESLDNFFTSLENSEPQKKVEDSLISIRNAAKNIANSKRDNNYKAKSLIELQQRSKQIVKSIEDELTVKKPRGVGLSKKVSNEWNAYQGQINRISNEIIRPAEREISIILSDIAKDQRLDLDTITLIDENIRNYINKNLKLIKSDRNEIEETVSSLSIKAREEAKKSFRSINKEFDKILVEIEHLKSQGLSDNKLIDKQMEFQEKIDAVYNIEKDNLLRLREQLNAALNFWEEDGIDTADLTEALEEELEALRARRDADLELAQLGMALSAVQHEFEKTVRSMRDGFRRLKSWADINPDLVELYKSMRTNFEHLDGYLNLFTPFDRRLQRKSAEISGQDILDFLRHLFKPRFERHDIRLVSTKDFTQLKINGYRSDFYPIFVNLIDNAIFWLQQVRDRDRTITLDADGTAILIQDNGPGISPRDYGNIFALSFSRKPGGRGMGLHLARETLAKIGYTINLDTNNESSGAIFIVSPQSASTNED